MSSSSLNSEPQFFQFAAAIRNAVQWTADLSGEHLFNIRSSKNTPTWIWPSRMWERWDEWSANAMVGKGKVFGVHRQRSSVTISVEWQHVPILVHFQNEPRVEWWLLLPSDWVISIKMGVLAQLTKKSGSWSLCQHKHTVHSPGRSYI